MHEETHTTNTDSVDHPFNRARALPRRHEGVNTWNSAGFAANIVWNFDVKCAI